LIPKGELLARLVNNLALLIVSIDAAKKKTYESIRRGAKFDRVIDNIRRFNLERNKILINKPELIFRTVLLRRNIEELPDYVRLAKSLEADGIGACHANIFRKDLKNESLVYHKELANRCLKQAKELIDFFGLSIYDFPPLFGDLDTRIDQPEQGADKPCIYLWREIFIEANGDVYPCCASDRQGLLMGNINESPLLDIWNNERYRLLRSTFKNNDLLPACRNCYLRMKSLAPDDENLYLRLK
jgi:radical SAM protein with 4Fe4S-binding SPASM domain